MGPQPNGPLQPLLATRPFPELSASCPTLWGGSDPVQDGDGEAVFVLPESRLLEAAAVIKAYRKRQLSPEQARAAAKRLRRFHGGIGA